MSEGPQFAAVDWGTSSFRLWLIGAGGGVLAERRSDEGMLSAGKTGFAAVLEAHLAAIGAARDLPIVMCGMVGARQGWLEAGYLDVPAMLGDIASHAVAIADADRDIRILPGLAQRRRDRADAMRGEETQLLGAAGAGGDGLYCMPGTHSKWVRVEAGRAAGFSTFMTGELYALMANHSILSHTVSHGPGTEPDTPAFRTAVQEGFEQAHMLTSKLFSIRAGQLLFGDDPAMAGARLSGLLIGAELAAGDREKGQGVHVTLIASGRMQALYEAAFATLDIAVTTIDADAAVRAGLITAARQFQFLPHEGNVA